MFGRKGVINPDKIDSLIGKSMQMEGKINSEGSVRIDGLVKGEIEVKGNVFIGETGRVNGNITTQNLLVAGEVLGDVKVRGRLEIGRTGHLAGTIETQVLVIAEGARYQGSCSMTQTPHDSGE
jgi:cytoskeletal protein CcmA (bactofilin family)